MTLTELERGDVESELIDLWADLGWLISYPPISEAAAVRKEEKLKATRQEIARLSRLLYVGGADTYPNTGGEG